MQSCFLFFAVEYTFFLSYPSLLQPSPFFCLLPVPILCSIDIRVFFLTILLRHHRAKMGAAESTGGSLNAHTAVKMCLLICCHAQIRFKVGNSPLTSKSLQHTA